MGLAGPDNVSASWSGVIIPPSTDTYTFYVLHDDSASLKIGTWATNYWGGCCVTETTTGYYLTEGVPYDFFATVENGHGPKNYLLYWSTPSMS